MWPFLYVFWYRIAVILSCPDEWWEKQWQMLETDKQKKLIHLIKKLFTENGLPLPMEGIDEITRDVCYKLSSEIWDYLETEIKSMFTKWANQIYTNVFLDPSRYTPNLARYYWNLIPLFGWQEGRQFLRSVQLAKPCTTARQKKLTDQEIKDLNKEVQKIVELKWNTMNIYYNAACYYAQLSRQDAQYIPCAMKYLKIACKDPGDSPDLGWVQNDPDFIPLRTNQEYSALFVDPKNKEISNESKEEKDRLNALDLLRKGAQQQQQKWGTISGKTQSPAALVIEAEYQITLWDNLIKFIDNPDDQLQGELFWQLVMQKAISSDAPSYEATEARLKRISSEILNTAWENITNHIQPQLDTWKNRLEDSKLFLQQPDSHNLNNILKAWKQSETWVWDYLSRQIKQVL